MRILIVDDNAVSNLLTEKYLELNGMDPSNIVKSKRGSEAVEIAKSQLFDLIIMDVRLPELNGTDAAQRIREHYGEDSPKIIAQTADVFMSDQEKSNFDAVIFKPVTIEEFSHQLIEVLEADYAQEEEMI